MLVCGAAYALWIRTKSSAHQCVSAPLLFREDFLVTCCWSGAPEISSPAPDSSDRTRGPTTDLFSSADRSSSRRSPVDNDSRRAACVRAAVLGRDHWTNRWSKLFFFSFSVEFFPVWRRRKSSGLTADCRRQHRHLRRDGSSWIRVAGACQRAGVPSSEHGQGGGLGVVERTRPLATVQRSGLPPYWERAEGGRPGKRSAGASGRPALSLRHWSAVYAPVSTGYR